MQWLTLDRCYNFLLIKMNENITKKQIIELIFYHCKEKNDFVFDNNFVKTILIQNGSSTNPYDMTKVDDISKLPKSIVDHGYALVHIGNGRHKFIKKLNAIYHKFEKIKENEIIEWTYRPSILNDFSVSESGILSLINNHKILNDFLYQDIVSAPKLYNSERKRGLSFNYKIGDDIATFDNLQIEIDLTAEYNGYVTIFEGKNTNKYWLTNFNVFQLYNPFRYYYNLKEQNKLTIKKITACYLLRQKINDTSFVRLYNYTFNDPYDITSISLLKKREYRLTKRSFDND
jgi:hypothetical protein